MIILAYAKLRSNVFTTPVIVDSEDTDVYVLAAFVSHDIQGELYIKRKRALISCRNMLEPEIAQVIIAAHIITGSDHTSGFYGHGKKSVMKKLFGDPEARELLVNVGKCLSLESNTKREMKTFVLTKIYGESIGLSCGQARASKWRKQKKKSTATLPPDQDSLSNHLQRTNYITYCQVHFRNKDHPSPIFHGWELRNGRCRPIRHTLAPLTQEAAGEERDLQRNLIDYVWDDSCSETDDDPSEFGQSTDSDEDI